MFRPGVAIPSIFLIVLPNVAFSYCSAESRGVFRHTSPFGYISWNVN
jgi:hypothetical protein